MTLKHQNVDDLSMLPDVHMPIHFLLIMHENYQFQSGSKIYLCAVWAPEDGNLHCVLLMYAC